MWLSVVNKAAVVYRMVIFSPPNNTLYIVFTPGGFPAEVVKNLPANAERQVQLWLKVP